MGVYVVRTSSLNDKHSCQLFRKASSLVLLSSSVSTAYLSCLLATTFSSLRFLFNLTSLQYFESGQRGFLLSHFLLRVESVVFYFLGASQNESAYGSVPDPFPSPLKMGKGRQRQTTLYLQLVKYIPNITLARAITYTYIMVRANFVLITRKEGGA